MSRTRHDQFAKQYLAGLLDPFGQTFTELEVTSEVRQIDLLFIPQQDASSAAVTEEFNALPRADWPSGVYFAPAGFRVVLVAVHQLPIGYDTLWLRVLGRNRVQSRAITELLDLPSGDPLRIEVLRLLTNWRIGLQQRQEVPIEDAEMAVQLSQAYLEWEQKTRKEAKLEAVPPLRQRGFSIEEIAQILGLSVEQVQSVVEAS